MPVKLELTLAICTYNRPQELERLLDSFWSQSVLPTSLMIIDDGRLPTELVEQFNLRASARQLSFRYVQKDQLNIRRGLSESKNLALELATTEIICFLDDDIVLEVDFLAALTNIWQEHGSDEQLIGVGGVIINNRQIGRWERIFHWLFCLSSQLAWDINEQGFQVWDDQINQLSRGYYAHGGLVSLRRQAAQQLGFPTFAGGRPALEDVDFSYRAKSRGYYFLVSPAIRATHHQSAVSREGAYLIGFKEGYNRGLIYYQAGTKKWGAQIKFFWAHSGWILRQFLAGHFATGWGMISGWYRYSRDKRVK